MANSWEWFPPSFSLWQTRTGNTLGPVLNIYIWNGKINHKQSCKIHVTIKQLGDGWINQSLLNSASRFLKDEHTLDWFMACCISRLNELGHDWTSRKSIFNHTHELKIAQISRPPYLYCSWRQKKQTSKRWVIIMEAIHSFVQCFCKSNS